MGPLDLAQHCPPLKVVHSEQRGPPQHSGSAGILDHGKVTSVPGTKPGPPRVPPAACSPFPWTVGPAALSGSSGQALVASSHPETRLYAHLKMDGVPCCDGR